MSITFPTTAAAFNGQKTHTSKDRRPHSMDKVERRQRAEEAHQEREREAQASALRQIRDNPQATPGERLEAVKLLLLELSKEQ